MQKYKTFLLTGGLYNCSTESDGVAAIVGGSFWGFVHGNLTCLRGESRITWYGHFNLVSIGGKQCAKECSW